MQNISKIDSVTQVFSYLEDPDVVSVASVCLQWAGQYHWQKGFLDESYCQRQSWVSCWVFGRATSTGVCQRVARCRCGENIPDDILTEILAQQVFISHTGVVLKENFFNFIKDNYSGMGRCWLGGRLGGLGGVGPSARGNTIPGEGGGT